MQEQHRNAGGIADRLPVHRVHIVERQHAAVVRLDRRVKHCACVHHGRGSVAAGWMAPACSRSRAAPGWHHRFFNALTAIPMTVRYPGFDTLALHAGQPPDPATGARAVPIYQTTSFVFRDTDHAAALFNMERAGHVYSRISNPTVAVLEERMAALEGGVGAIATASGQAALHLAIATLMGAGAHIVACRALYGGSHNLLAYTLHALRHRDDLRQPARPRRMARGDPAEYAAAVRRDARQSGPRRARHPGGLRNRARARPAAAGRLDLHHAVPDEARSTSAPTCSTTRPPSSSAGTASPSAACWSTAAPSTGRPAGNFPKLTEPYAGFHGMDFRRKSTVAPFLLRARREGLRDFGACMSPQTAFQILQGIETLPLRMQRHVENTRKVVEFLAAHPAVESVALSRNCPSHPDHALAQAAAAARLRRGVQLRPQGRRARRGARSSNRCACSRTSPTSATRSRW